LISNDRAGDTFDIDLIKGKLTHDDGYTTQLLTVKNNMPVALRSIFVECGFFYNDELIGSGTSWFQNVLPGQKAYDTMTQHVVANRTDCRISIVEKAEVDR
jgi:hypothetical protein